MAGNSFSRPQGQGAGPASRDAPRETLRLGLRPADAWRRHLRRPNGIAVRRGLPQARHRRHASPTFDSRVSTPGRPAAFAFSVSSLSGLAPWVNVCYASSVSLIQLDNLTRRYGRRRGVESLSFSVGEGALFGFLGPNGAGKTTTIRVLLGFLRPTSGAAKIFGLDCWRDSKAIKRDIGYLPGDLRLPAWMDGANALSIFGAVRGRDLAGAGRELAEKFDLDLRVKVRDMSRGMRQKLGLILALAHSPRLLVLDE